METMLRVDNLSVRFNTATGIVHALSDVTFTLDPGETLVIVGESGCGKTVLAHALLRLLPLNAKQTGTVTLGHTVLTELSETKMARHRGSSIALVPQSAGTALNPVLTIERQLRDISRVRGLPWDAGRMDIEQALDAVGLHYAAIRRKYAHQLSGGMQQRIVNAAAMLGKPALVIADEPTHGIDPERIDTTASLLGAIPKQGCALLVITHDLQFARRLGGRIGLMYGSYLTEIQAADDFLDAPLHPYGQGLLRAMPENGLHEIPGHPPSLTALPPGCPFGPRCPHATEACSEAMPPPIIVNNSIVRCTLYAAS